MAQDVLELVEEYMPGTDQRRWSKLSSDITSRRLELLLLREILLELRKISEKVMLA